MGDRPEEIRAIENEIDRLPKGNITYRSIRGKRRMYLQWTEDGKRKSLYIKAGEEASVCAAVMRRKELEQQLRIGIYAQSIGRAFRVDKETVEYETRVVTGDALSRLCGMAKGYGRRGCFRELKAYIKEDIDARVCIVYGLRRTGKTVMSLQAISELPPEETVYIKILTTDNMAMLNRDLLKLQRQGVKYVFIDEVTLMADFTDTASLLSDVYAASGMKLVLSGTDSLGFALASGDELYDRVRMIHTTFIPFREYSRLLGYHDVDEYIRYGGTFRAGELTFGDEAFRDEELSFKDDESTRRYIDTSIARNIQHSLSSYKSGGHFRHLTDLYEAGELTNVINRVIEDMNHRFLLSVLTRDFESHDLGSARQLERKRAAFECRESIFDQLNDGGITENLRKLLDIRNSEELSVELTSAHVEEIKRYLYMLDLIVNIPSESISGGPGIEHIVFSQPGMRYCQAQALVYSLMQDEMFMAYPAKERKAFADGILEEVRGRMLEEIVLLETAKTLSRGFRVFKLLFEAGEFDMVVYDEKELKCKIYEIKHSSRIVESQYRHLLDKKKCEETEFRYGEITDRIVLYNGEDETVDGVKYVNVVSYLEGLNRP